MKYALTFIILSLLLTACSRRAQIVGTWHEKSGTIAIVFNSDGSFSSGGDHNHGTWQISDKILTMTLTNTTDTHPGGKIGDTVRCEIIRADSHVLAYMVGGQTISFSR
jgi:hypothetical protein